MASVKVKSVCVKTLIENRELLRADHFEVKEADETFVLQDGQVLVKTLYISLDPILRLKMNRDASPPFSPWTVGEPCMGVGVGVVLESKYPEVSVHDIVESRDFPWKSQFAIDGKLLNKFEHDIFKKRPSLALGCCGLTGLTAYFGVREKCNILQEKRQTIVVSGAAGGVGSVAGQIAKVKGASNVVGICGSEAKCKILTEELGFDGVVNYKADDIPAALRKLCPNGVDSYFDNVGGEISNHVIKQMNKDSFVAVCGQISNYNKDVGFLQPPEAEIAEIIKQKNIHREFFAVSNYKAEYKQAVSELARWYMDGKLKAKETVLDGIENTGNAFVSVMTGGNLGKQLVRVSGDF